MIPTGFSEEELHRYMVLEGTLQTTELNCLSNSGKIALKHLWQTDKLAEVTLDSLLKFGEIKS